MIQAQKGRVIYLNTERQNAHRIQEEEDEKLRIQMNGMPGLECMESVLREQMNGTAKHTIQNLVALLEKNYCQTYSVVALPQPALRLFHTRASLFYVRHCAELMMRLKKEVLQEKQQY